MSLYGKFSLLQKSQLMTVIIISSSNISGSSSHSRTLCIHNMACWTSHPASPIIHLRMDTTTPQQGDCVPPKECSSLTTTAARQAAPQALAYISQCMAARLLPLVSLAGIKSCWASFRWRPSRAALLLVLILLAVHCCLLVLWTTATFLPHPQGRQALARKTSAWSII